MGRLWDWGILCLWHTIMLQWELSCFWNKIRAHVYIWIWKFWIKGSFDGLWEGWYKTTWIQNVWSYNRFLLELIMKVIIAGNEVRRYDDCDNNCKFWVGFFKLTLPKRVQCAEYMHVPLSFTWSHLPSIKSPQLLALCGSYSSSGT